MFASFRLLDSINNLRAIAHDGGACQAGLVPMSFQGLHFGHTLQNCVLSTFLRPLVVFLPTAAERGDEIRSCPQVGKVATSALPYRVSPPLQSGGIQSEVAHKSAKLLPHPCRTRFPTASERGDKIRSGPQVGELATPPLPYRGSPPLQSGGIKSEVAHKWATWLPLPCRLGGPQCFIAGDKIGSGPHVSTVAT